MKKSASTTQWKRCLALSALSLFTTSTFSYICGKDNYGFVYICCGEYKCAAGEGIQCSTVATPGSSTYVIGVKKVIWAKESACTASAGWQISSVCPVPLGIVTAPCTTQSTS